MARILSPVWSMIRGSVAGTTYLANQYHQIVARQRTAPVQPNTNRQTQLRSSFAAAAQAWKALTDAERLAWEQIAATVPFAGPLGTYYVTGRNLMLGATSLQRYIKLLYQPTLTVVNTAPIVAGRYALDSVESNDLAAPGTGFQIDINNFADRPVAWLADCSIAFNPSRIRYKGPYDSTVQQSELLAAASTGICTFDNLTVDQRYFWRIRAVVASAAGVAGMQTVVWRGSHIAATTV